MARKRLSMRKTKEILRLKYEVGLTNRQIAGSCGTTHTTVNKCLQRAQEKKIGWPLPDLSDAELEELLYGASRSAAPRRELPDMAAIAKELRRKHVTLMLLWEEYRAEHPSGYGYTQFCGYYRKWENVQEPCMRLIHVAGERMFVDWAGPTIRIGEGKAILFVAVLGASNYTYVEAFENMQLPSWIAAHIHALEYFEGSALIWVPDNTKTGVIKAGRYEWDLHRTYQECAEHYGAVVIPARPRKPQDKSKVENGVLHAERRILAALRNVTFFSLIELNRAIAVHLEELNKRPFQKMDGSRLELYRELEKPVLLPLPRDRYAVSAWRTAKVNIDYHASADNHFYSVPHRLVGRELDVRLTDTMVELFDQSQRVAIHPRSFERGKFTTLNEHRPKSHQKHLAWTPSRLIEWAGRDVGPQCSKMVRSLLEDKPHPEMGYRACLGLMRLAKGHGRERMEAACHRALALETCSYRSIQSILKTKLDMQPLPRQEPEPPPPKSHGNIRGKEYYEQMTHPPEAI